MALLGLKYPIIYQAKNLQSGLTNINVKIIKPDNSILGTFLMTEMTSQGMSGVYKYDLVTSNSDLKGDWIGLIDSISESYKTALKIDFDVPNVSGGIVDTSVKIPKIFVKSSNLQFLIKKSSLIQSVKNIKIIKNIKKSNKTTKLVKNKKIIGVVKCKNF